MAMFGTYRQRMMIRANYGRIEKELIDNDLITRKTAWDYNMVIHSSDYRFNGYDVVFDFGKDEIVAGCVDFVCKDGDKVITAFSNAGFECKRLADDFVRIII